MVRRRSTVRFRKGALTCAYARVARLRRVGTARKLVTGAGVVARLVVVPITSGSEGSPGRGARGYGVVQQIS
jgi:hypothetical protein